MTRDTQYCSHENGNVLVYVLIAVGLFAALGFTLSRQARNTGTQEITTAQAELNAMEMIGYAAQTRSAIQKMIFTGSTINELVFTKPGEAGFGTAPHIHKVYHPQGGGLTPATLPRDAVAQITSPPDAGWYLGRFNNVAWTDSTGTDVLLTAYQISKPVCEAINKKITGSTTIPALAGDMDDYLLDTATDLDLDVAACGGCEGYPALCVSNPGATSFSFYNIVIGR